MPDLVPAVAGGPCTWPNVEPLCLQSVWEEFEPEIRAQALTFAIYIVWAATGRQFGLCELTVRPCGRACFDNNWGGWYYDGQGGWVPYIGTDGQWYNGCGCGNGPGCQTCQAECSVYLPGPVYDVLSVRVDGTSLPVTGGDFFIYDQQWLIRSRTPAQSENGEAHCWPWSANLNLPPGDPNAFEVTYRRGLPVPDALAMGTANYAIEYAKACLGQVCRLPGRVSSISRQGISVNMVDINEVLQNGLTGLLELDQLIMMINPTRLKGRTRFFSLDTPEPRQITWAG